jgi:hypothetical protein
MSANKHDNTAKGDDIIMYNQSRSSIRHPNIEQAGRMITTRLKRTTAETGSEILRSQAQGIDAEGDDEADPISMNISVGLGKDLKLPVDLENSKPLKATGMVRD